MSKFSDPEIDLLEFLGSIRNVSIKHIEKMYIMTKQRFDFRTPQYRNLFLDTLPMLYAPLCDDTTDEGVVRGCQVFSLLYMYRMISYETQELNAGRPLDQQIAINHDQMKQWSDYYNRDLIDMTLLDYGCGTASRSLAFCKKYNMKVILLDVNALMLDFACFRFQKNNIPYMKIKVDTDNIYPKIRDQICSCVGSPTNIPVDLAIMFNAVEHLREPSIALRNIIECLNDGACLKINNINHPQKQEWQHLSPDMKEARQWLNNNMQKISDIVWKK